jgi:hypothetical protein
VIAVVLVLLLCGAAIAIWRDKLGDLEQRCKSEFMKSEPVSGFRIGDEEVRKPPYQS